MPCPVCHICVRLVPPAVDKCPGVSNQDIGSGCIRHAVVHRHADSVQLAAGRDISRLFNGKTRQRCRVKDINLEFELMDLKAFRQTGLGTSVDGSQAG